MVEKKYLPVFLDLNGKHCLVVGGGKIALRKVKTLVEYGAIVIVIGKIISADIKNICSKFYEREFRESDILLNEKENQYFLIIAGTSSVDINLKIVEMSEKMNILVNNITSKEHMNTRFCSVLEVDDGIVGISGKGNPKKALEIKEKILSGKHLINS